MCLEMLENASEMVWDLGEVVGIWVEHVGNHLATFWEGTPIKKLEAHKQLQKNPFDTTTTTLL